MGERVLFNNGQYNHNVLVVEDKRDTQAFLLRILSRYSISADLASNGQEAVDFFRNDPSYYDIIFMDFRLPYLDGRTASKIIKDERKEQVIIGLSNSQLGVENGDFENKVFSEIIKTPFQFKQFEEVFEKYSI